MEPLTLNPVLASQIIKMIAEGQTNEHILAKLKNDGCSVSELDSAAQYIKQLKLKKRTKRGSMFVLAGVLMLGLGFISCVVLHNFNYDINFSLYGLTGIGAILLIAGLIMIFS